MYIDDNHNTEWTKQF